MGHFSLGHPVYARRFFFECGIAYICEKDFFSNVELPIYARSFPACLPDVLESGIPKMGMVSQNLQDVFRMWNCAASGASLYNAAVVRGRIPMSH